MVALFYESFAMQPGFNSDCGPKEMEEQDHFEWAVVKGANSLDIWIYQQLCLSADHRTQATEH